MHSSTAPRFSISVLGVWKHDQTLITLLSSLRAPMLWFMDLNVANCHIQYIFSEFMPIVSKENEKKKMKNSKFTIFV